MNKWESIPLPTEGEKRRSIQTILACGMPMRQSLSYALPDLLRSIGIRGLFFGAGDCLFLAAMGAGLLGFALFASAGSRFDTLYMLVFLTSPFLYGLLHLLTAWKEFGSGTYALVMTCRCNLRQVTALRMMVFGGVSTLWSTIVAVVLTALSSGQFSALRLISISFSALFLFAALQISIERKCRAPQSYGIVPAIWILLCMALLALGKRAEILLAAVPTAVFAVTAALALVCYFGLLKRYYFEQKEGEIAHVVS